MQKYPYYNVNKVEGGMLTKVFKNRHFNTQEDAVIAFNKWRENHLNIEGQYVILHYTSYYTSRICMIFEGSTITWID